MPCRKMGGSTKTNMSTTVQPPPSPTTLHTKTPMRRQWFNRIFAFTYTLAFLALLYQNFLNLINSPTKITSFLMLLADFIFAFMAISYQGFLVNPISRETFPENVAKVAKEEEFMALDVFICTADPYKEPPIVVVNTALSVMAYDYPVEKLSVYVSDDGGSKLTLFALMEAAKFAKHWLPYCNKYDIVERCPEAYFDSNPDYFQETDDIKVMLTDFGLAKEIDESSRSNSMCGTTEYMAPEILLAKGHNKDADWWSVGILLYEMLTGKPPFIHANRKKLQEKIINEKVKLLPRLTTEVHSLLKGLLQKDPAKRLGSGPSGADEIKNHKWFRSINWTNLESRELPTKFKPDVEGEDCTANFDKCWTTMPLEDSPAPTPTAGEHFHGYTYVAPNHWLSPP